MKFGIWDGFGLVVGFAKCSKQEVHSTLQSGQSTNQCSWIHQNQPL